MEFNLNNRVSWLSITLNQYHPVKTKYILEAISLDFLFIYLFGTTFYYVNQQDQTVL